MANVPAMMKNSRANGRACVTNAMPNANTDPVAEPKPTICPEAQS